MRKRRPVSKPVWITLAVVYAIALLLSHKAQTSGKSFPLITNQSPAGIILLPARHADGSPIDNEQQHLFLRRFQPPGTIADQTPVVMIHGSPGDGGAFNTLAQLIANTGRAVLVPDLPGYGRSGMAENLSYESQARVMFDLLDAHSIDRAHIVGWSSGGGVALQMTNQHPDRTATITLLAAVGAQETEGSGSYAFEHFKYAIGIGAVGYLPELIPHFGILGDFNQRTGWLRAFWDSDQRKLDPIMGSTQTPTLIMHGRHDPLIGAWAAEKHHELMPGVSRLVMLDAMHFIPMLHPDQATEHLAPFFARHDTPGVAPLTNDLNLAPVPGYKGFDRILHATGDWVRDLPWYIQIAGVILLVRFFPHLGILLAMLVVAMMRLDFAVALGGMLVGRTWWLVHGASTLDRPWTILGWIRSLLFMLPAAIIGIIFGSLGDSLPQRFGVLGFLFAIASGYIVLRFTRLVFTWEGRQRIKAWFGRTTNHEYWPAAIIYLPVFWMFIKRMSLKKIARVSAANPGYPPDGGINEDFKAATHERLGDDPSLLPLALIDPNTDYAVRLGRATNTVRTNTDLGGYPIIAKPDCAEHGDGVALIRDEMQLESYLHTHREPIVLQKYHPGPCEFGVVWVRNPDSIRDPEIDPPHGSIYSVTIKHFPSVVGDGKHSVRRLVLAHKRHRNQARMFLQRLRPMQHWIPDEGETVQLGLAGNHKQGAMFTDGHHLITAALESSIDAIASNFRDEDGNRFDIGRFDLRCESLEALSEGEFATVELNGLTSEPTNMYDPTKSIFWAWRVHKGYWHLADQLAQARIETGTGTPITASALRQKLLWWFGRSVRSWLKPGR